MRRAAARFLHRIAHRGRDSGVDLAAARRRTPGGRQVAVPGVVAGQLVAGSLDGPDAQLHRLDAAQLKRPQNFGVAVRHRFGHREAEAARQHLAGVGVIGHGLDAAVQGGTEDVGAQRVAVLVGAIGAGHGAHERGEVAQLPLARVRDGLPDAVVVHPLLDLTVVDEAERLPVGRCLLAPDIGAQHQVLADLLAERFVERPAEEVEVATQFVLGQSDRVACRRMGRRAGRRSQAVAKPRRHRRGGRPDLVHRRLEGGGKRGSVGFTSERGSAAWRSPV